MTTEGRQTREAKARTTTLLRKRLDGGMVTAASCYDPFTARLAEMAGFQAIHLTGFGVEITQLGAPDLGLMTLTELTSNTSRMAAAVNVPILADIDTGFGGTLNIQRTIREMERAGAAGIHIEDQSNPKHCPLVARRSVVDRAEAIDRVAAAVDARTDPDFVIVARSDADTVGFDELVTRSNLFLEAGADMAMPMLMSVNNLEYASLTPDEKMRWLERLVAEIDGPVMGMGDAPPAGYTATDLAEMGFAFVMYGGATLSATANAVSELFESILLTGSDSSYRAAHPGRYNSPLELMKAVHLDAYTSKELRFLSK
ncbi:MAG: isocitrate lyase/PEP mutase family protein [Bradyrhizobium sp.]